VPVEAGMGVGPPLEAVLLDAQGKTRDTLIGQAQWFDPDETRERQKASTAWSIGTQPSRPAVYGVKAPL
jgi:hypothetical protein